MKGYNGPSTALLLKVLREANGELVSTRVLKDKVGADWREAMQALRNEGYTFDEVIGASNNRSFRLSEEQPSTPAYLTEPAPPPVVLSKVEHGKTVKVTLSAEDIRSLLRGDVLPTARDALVGGLMRLTEGE